MADKFESAVDPVALQQARDAIKRATKPSREIQQLQKATDLYCATCIEVATVAEMPPAMCAVAFSQLLTAAILQGFVPEERLEAWAHFKRVIEMELATQTAMDISGTLDPM